MISNHINNAEYLIECAEKNCRSQKHNLSSTKWNSLHAKLQDAFLEEAEEDNVPYNKETFSKFEKNPLQRLCASNDNINRLIVNLFPADNGYSLMIKTSSKQYAESLQLPYDESDILQYIDNEQIPPMLIDTLNLINEEMFYSGCVIAEIRDYRIAACLNNYETRFVLLQPTQQTLLGDVNAIASETSNLFTWENEERLNLESYLVLATSDPLCLAPSPTVQVMKNILHNRRRLFKRHSIKRCLRRNGMNAILRRKENKLLPTPEPLKLFDFLQKAKTKRKEMRLAPGEIRLPKDAIDVWRKSPVELSYPSDGIDVAKHAKAIDPKQQGIFASDLLEVQQVLLRSESQNRDVYSRISIYQRPSDMQYFGRLLSNKYFQASSDNPFHASSSCRFLLGTEHRANLYILQYQELFAEDGRRPAAVVVNRPLQQDKVQYQIPFLHQPWQLEQDKSLYAVGSINNIPVKHWHRLRINPQSSTRQQRYSSGQQVPGNLQRSHSSTNQSTASTCGVTQQLSSTTPTLNAATLQPDSQSPFVFPTPQQTIDISQSPRQHSGSQSLLERKISADGIALLNSGNASVYHLAESNQSGNRSRHGSTQEVFTFSSVNVQGSQGCGSSLNSSHVTPAVLESKTINVDPAVAMSTAPTQSSITKSAVQLKGISSQPIAVQAQNSGTTVLRLPVTINASNTTGGQQIAINVIGNTRVNSSQLVGNIQLAPASHIQGSTVIDSNQIPAEFAMQLAAAANQIHQDKINPSSSVQQLSISTSGISTSGPITFVANNNSLVGSQQPQHILAKVGAGQIQQQQYVRASDQPGQSATITYNPRTQRLTANVPGTSVQQPVQLLQVGSNIQQLPIRIPAQQLLLDPARTSTDNTSLTLTQHLQMPSSNTSTNCVKRNRKRKSTVDHGK